MMDLFFKIKTIEAIAPYVALGIITICGALYLLYISICVWIENRNRKRKGKTGK